MGFQRLIFLCLTLVLCVRTQVDIHDKSEDYLIRQKQEVRDELNKEIYTSMYELVKFFEKEKEYVEDLRIIMNKKLVGVDAQGSVGAYIASYEDIIGGQDEDETFLHNPLNVYNLIRHVAVGWNIIEENLKKEKERRPGQLPKRVRRVLARSKREHIPGAEDLDGVAAGLVRLHDYYKFDIKSFVEEGAIETDEWRSETTGDLTVWDAFKIGTKGANQMLLGSGIDIMIGAMEKAKEEGMVSVPPFIENLDLKVLKNLIKTAKTVHDQKLDRWGPRTNTHSTNTVPYDRRLAKKKKFQEPKQKKYKLWDANIIESRTEADQYLALCRGEELRPASVTSKLYCRYTDNGVPYYRYGPRKIEIVSFRPHIVLVHDFITPSESKDMIATAAPKLIRSKMVGKNQTGNIDDRRVSSQAWLTESDHPAVEGLTNKIDLFFNLESRSSNHSELYQVANYGLAGQYNVHYDQTMMSKSYTQREIYNIWAGDRVATIMGYLSDVEAGGYTVFPLAGAYVKPRKGTVVLWWNMDKAGGYDVLTRHGGCPVMVGSKWIANKWIRINSQMFRRPCPKYSGKQVRHYRNQAKMQKGEFFADPA